LLPHIPLSAFYDEKLLVASGLDLRPEAPLGYRFNFGDTVIVNLNIEQLTSCADNYSTTL
jgi:hypothetical protein